MGHWDSARGGLSVCGALRGGLSVRGALRGGLSIKLNQSIFYFMSVHIEVILDKNKKQKHIIVIYTNFPTGL